MCSPSPSLPFQGTDWGVDILQVPPQSNPKSTLYQSLYTMIHPVLRVLQRSRTRSIYRFDIEKDRDAQCVYVCVYPWTMGGWAYTDVHRKTEWKGKKGRREKFLKFMLLLELASLKFIGQATKNQPKFYKTRQTENAKRYFLHYNLENKLIIFYLETFLFS